MKFILTCFSAVVHGPVEEHACEDESEYAERDIKVDQNEAQQYKYDDHRVYLLSKNFMFCGYVQIMDRTLCNATKIHNCSFFQCGLRLFVLLFY
jgi:hypothetical protein